MSDSKGPHYARGEELAKFGKWLVAALVKVGDDILAITNTGEVAVVSMFEGERTTVRALKPEERQRLIDTSAVAGRWVQRKIEPGAVARVLFLDHRSDGSLLLNYTPDDGWNLEPESTDLGRQKFVS